MTLLGKKNFKVVISYCEFCEIMIKFGLLLTISSDYYHYKVNSFDVDWIIACVNKGDELSREIDHREN